MNDLHSPKYVCVGSIFIDDIVYPDGRTVMGVLGGAGTHAAAGICVWGERPGLVANSGVGMPAEAQAHMDRDFDMRGIVQVDVPQGRAWQIFEWDNRRIEIFRVDNIEPFAFSPQPDKLYKSFFDAEAYTILRGAENFLKWREALPTKLLLWEPDSLYMQASNREEYRYTIPYPDMVSPNLLEARRLTELDDPHDILNWMIDNGAKIAALRMGELGSLVAAQGMTRNEYVIVKPTPVPEIIDQTGAGNSFCGGFLYGYHQTQDVRLAAYHGAISASFTLEVMGLADPTRADLAEKRAERYQWMLANH